MDEPNPLRWLGALLVAVGSLLATAGLALLLAPRIPWLGRLPGDIVVRGDSFSLHFPLATCLLLSLLLTLLLNVILRR